MEPRLSTGYIDLRWQQHNKLFKMLLRKLK